MGRLSSKQTWTSAALFVALVAVCFGAIGFGAFGQTTVAQETDGIAAARALENAFTKAISDAEASIVSIARIKRRRPTAQALLLDPFPLQRGNRNRPPNFDITDSPDFTPNDFGTGVIIAAGDDRSDRLILTNYHVVKGGPPAVVKGGPPAERPPDESEYRLYARFANRRDCDVQILAADPRSDLAVLKIDYTTSPGIRPGNLKPLKLARNPVFKKGKLVLALGNPYAIARDGSASASWGMISNIGRRPAPFGPPDDPETFRHQTLHHLGTLLTIDSRLDLGSSGGALIDLKGELVGITTSLAALDGYEKSVGYAVPLDAATRRVIDSLVQGYEVEYGFLGVGPDDLSPKTRKKLLTSGYTQGSAAIVRNVIMNSPAKLAGLQREDIILAVNGQPIYGKDDLVRRIGQLGPLANARLQIWRDDVKKELHLNAKLGKWPVYDEDDMIVTMRRHPAWRGLVVDFPTSRRRYLPEPFRYHRAVVVTSVAEQSKTFAAGLRPGDFITHVNQTPVSTPYEFQEATRELAGTVTLELADNRQIVLIP